MSADATIRAEMSMDNAGFRAAVNDSTKSLRQLKTEAREIKNEITGASDVMIGFGNIARGNVAGGVQQIVRNLDKISPAAMAAAKSIGAIGAGLGVGVSLGRMIDDATGFSDKVGAWLGNLMSPQEMGDPVIAEMARIRGARNKDLKEAQKANEELQEMMRKRLKGEAKLEDEYQREMESLRQRKQAARGGEEIKALEALMQARTQLYNEDIDALRTVEAERTRILEEAAQRRAQLEQAQAEASLTREKERNRSMMISMLEGSDKIRAQYEADISDVNKQLENANDDMKAVLEDRRRMIRESAEKQLGELLDREAMEAGKQQDARRGGGMIRASNAMAAQGSMLGGERNMLNLEDKKIRLMEQHRVALNDIRTHSNNTAEAVRALLDEQTGVR